MIVFLKLFLYGLGSFKSNVQKDFFNVVWQAKWKGKKPGIISIIDKEESNIEKQENLLYHVKICYK